MAVDTSKLLQRAKEAVEKNNFKYAVELYQQILAINPDNVESRTLLRAAQSRVYEESGGSPIKAYLKGIVSLVKIGFFTLLKSHDKSMIECERFLCNDPKNKLVLLRLAASAHALNYFKTAESVYRYIINFDSDNIKVLKALGGVLRDAKKVSEAIDCYQSILNINRSDFEASRAIKDLSAMAMSQRIEGAKDAREIVRDRDETAKLESLTHEARTEEEVNARIKIIKAELEERPEDVQRHISLGDLYLRKLAFDEAKAAYQKAYELRSTDYNIQIKFNELETRKIEIQLENLKKKAAQDPAAKAQFQQGQVKLVKFKLQDYEGRVKHYPTDISYRFELAKLYYQTKQFDKAIQNFQITRQDPARRSTSMNMIGLCFVNKKDYDMAIEQFQGALEKMEVMNDQKKLITYNLADAMERMGKKAEALAQFKVLYEHDIAFKDVKTRFERLRK